MRDDQVFEMWWGQHAVQARYAEMDEAIGDLCKEAARCAWQAKELAGNDLPLA